MVARRWQDSANLILGAWLFVSPWVLDHAGTTAALNAHVMGAAVVVFAVIAAYMPKAWEEMINTLLGVWLVLSPFVLGFAATSIVALHTVVVGILATAFAVWAMASDKRLYERWHRRHSV
jgi:ABC-type molybdate transport system permease subunit